MCRYIFAKLIYLAQCLHFKSEIFTIAPFEQRMNYIVYCGSTRFDYKYDTITRIQTIALGYTIVGQDNCIV